MFRLLLVLLFLLPNFGYAAEPCITHSFVSQKTQGGDATVVGPNEWNDCHAEPPKTLTFVVGSSGGTAVLVDGDDFADFWANDTGRTLTITKVTCKSNAGNPTIQLQRDDGAPVNMFSSNMTCDPTPSGTDGSDGILTSFVGTENVLSPGHWLNFLMVAAGGTAKQITLSIIMTVPAP